MAKPNAKKLSAEPAASKQDPAPPFVPGAAGGTQHPTVGRIVHYVTPEPLVHRAAIITAVLDGGPGIGVDSIGLCVFLDDQLLFVPSALFDVAKLPGTWHWPEREWV